MLPTSLPLSLPLAYLFTLVGALVMVGGVSFLKSRGWTTSLQGRKLMHCATGPVFVLCWMLFPSNPILPWLSPLLAASVPLGVALYMLACARGWCHNRHLVSTVSRSGSAGELQQGPFFYGLIHALAAFVYWTDNPTGMVSLLVLCVGDGVADLVGRPYGRHRWGWNRAKSVEGSAAFVAVSMVTVVAFVSLFQQQGFMTRVGWAALQRQIPLTVVIAALVESLPLGAYDNIGVFAAVVACGRFFEW